MRTYNSEASRAGGYGWYAYFSHTVYGLLYYYLVYKERGISELIACHSFHDQHQYEDYPVVRLLI